MPKTQDQTTDEDTLALGCLHGQCRALDDRSLSPGSARWSFKEAECDRDSCGLRSDHDAEQPAGIRDNLTVIHALCHL